MSLAGWNPTTEEQLEEGAKNALLTESHHMDIKRELPAGKGANRELARDLASFATDGGLLLLGVDESSEGPALYPIPLAGLAERVEQVARHLIDEPLLVQCTAIPSKLSRELGYLVIRIPSSPLAPHMVDGRYYGRGDKTKHVLSEDEVFRLHQRRRDWEQNASRLLDEYISRDPVSSGTQAHLFVVAEPVAAQHELLLGRIEADGTWQRNLIDLVHTRAMQQVPSTSGFEPNPRSATTQSRRPDGWALTTSDFLEGRAVTADAAENRLLEIEISESGTVRLYCGRGTDDLRSGPRVVLEDLVVVLTHSVLAIAKTIAVECGYLASWNLGVAIVGLRGAVSLMRVQSYSASTPTFSDDVYRQGTRASLEELQQVPNKVADRLLGRLIRSLGTRNSEPMRALLD